jgi:hypothetical protein
MRLLLRPSPAVLSALILAFLPGMPAVPGMPLAPVAAGQAPGAGSLGQGARVSFPGGLRVGSEGERYLRVLQVAGLTRPHPWTLRGFTPREVALLLPSPGTPHPWEAEWGWAEGSLEQPDPFGELAELARQRAELAREPAGTAPDPAQHSRDQPAPPRGRTSLGWVEPEAGVLFNSAIPSGENDGALWAGKGFSTSVRGGFWARLGPLHLRLAPEVFWTENASFRLAPNGEAGEAAFRDPRFPSLIDHPQRFGEEEFARLDPGSSALHLELPLLTLGASGAPQWWGPTLHYPLMLGNNAGGFYHAFLQTGSPLKLWIVRLHARVLGGRLDQSPYSPVQEGETRRFTSGATLVMTPRGLPGLEVGAQRMAVMAWPQGGIGWGQVGRPFSSMVSSNDGGQSPDEEHQLAGAFFRWAFPGAGLEVYGEILREELAEDARQYLVEPHHRMARVFGFQRVWAGEGGSLMTLRGEVVSSERHHSERQDRFLGEGIDPRPLPRYADSQVRQGHTHRGQLLGSPTAYGGSGWTLGVDRYHRKGRWSLDISRALRLDWLPSLPVDGGANRAEVGYTLKLEGVRHWGGVEWGAAAAPSWHLNRNLARGNDLFNMRMELWGRGLPR